MNEEQDILSGVQYDEENLAIEEATENQARIDAQKAVEVQEADPALKTPEGQTRVPGPGDTDQGNKPLGSTDTKLNQETGKEEKVERTYSDNDAVRGIQETTDAIMDDPLLGTVGALGAGVVDTTMDVVGLLPWLKPADDWYDENFGRDRSKNDLTKAVRDISAIVVPSLAGGAGIWAKAGAGISKLGKVGKAVSASKHAMTVGRIATDMAVSTTVAGVSEQTTERGNASSAIGQLFGIQTPWDTSHIDDPDVRWQMNMTEEIALGSFGAVLDGFFSITGKGAKAVAKKGDEVAETAIAKSEAPAEAALAKADGDELTAAVDGRQTARQAAQDAEAVKRYEQMELDVQTGQPAKYDAFINEPAEPQSRVVMNYDADPVNFKMDVARIENPIQGKTVNARNGRPAVTDTFKNDLAQAPDGTTRNKLLMGLAKDLEPKFSTVVGENTLSEEQVEAAVEAFAAKAQNQTPGEFRKSVEELMGQTDKIMGNNVRVLDRDGFNIANKAFAKAFDILDPAKMKASGIVAGQAGKDVSDLSRAIGLGGEVMDTTRQQELVWENLKVLLPEIRASQYLDGWRLNADKFAKAMTKGDDISAYAKWMSDTGEGFEVTLKAERENALRFINTMVDVSKQNPEYFKPLLREFAKSGDVDTVYKLSKKMEQKVQLWRKAFVDGNPEVPSEIVKQLQATRYNNILSGLAPVRALGGAAIGLAGKPFTVMVGSKLTGDSAAFKRAAYTYGGIVENFGRAMQVMRQEWNNAVTDPSGLGKRGVRADQDIARVLKEDETMDLMAEAWEKNGEWGKAMMWQMTKNLSRFNNNPVVRFGINSMYSIDGFVKSMTASANARSIAYDELFSASKGAIDEKSFNALQKKLYDGSFDNAGILKDDAALYAAGEINLNLDNNLVSGLESMAKNFPIIKSIMMFPRTGMNSVQLMTTFNPTGVLGLSIGKARRVMKAKSADAIEAVLVEHGLGGKGMPAFNALKAEYKGREAMGASVTMGAALLAFNGGLTGSGPQDAGEKRRMQGMGWKPYSIKNPLTGEWHSYQGLEPFDTYLGMTADIIFQHTRVDQAASEDWLRAVMSSISYNITNKTFLSGFEPLAGLVSGDPHSFNRFFAMQADSFLPGTGARSILNKAVTPQLKDVENNWLAYLANRNTWLPVVNAELMDYKDVYTGKPINTGSPWNSAVNAMLPFLKTNEGMEEWRQKLLATGWDNLQVLRTHPSTGEALKPAERQFVNNWIADNYNLGERVDKLLSQNDNFWMKETKKYAKARGQKKQSEFPIKETVVHQLLDDLHNQAFTLAMSAMNQQYSAYSNTDALQEGVKAQLRAGDIDSAKDTAEKLIQYGKN